MIKIKEIDDRRAAHIRESIKEDKLMLPRIKEAGGHEDRIEGLQESIKWREEWLAAHEEAKRVLDVPILHMLG